MQFNSIRLQVQSLNVKSRIDSKGLLSMHKLYIRSFHPRFIFLIFFMMFSNAVSRLAVSAKLSLGEAVAVR